MVTTGVVEEAVSTTDPGAAVPPGTVPVPRPVISAADGKNTAWPRPRIPVWVTPRCACSTSSA